MINLTKCESCNSLIHSKQINIHDNTIKSGIQARYWDCPHCNHKHLILVMDKTSKRLMKDNKKDRERMASINKRAQALRMRNQLSDGQAKLFVEQVEKIETRIKKRTDQLDVRSKKLIKDYEASHV
ncbi:hypothetical protein JUJ52_11100 [Virgibacillus sp. AGTR]|uniref:hypothetical protein n=1 Tax=Virgibacillus sp. AGTR TaxID=2812055 RepID=UPI001D16ED17|nr:hypothetical protein [Virgibacillus sp. AGTR]MCC2250508.1 hypothetical protein [Virgibacillus sp. AGTR]